MARKSSNDVKVEEEEVYLDQDQAEIDAEDEQEEMVENNMEISQELQEDYGSPEPEGRFNAHSFIHKATFDQSNSLRTTFLQEGELGRPLFTVRTMLDMITISKHYIDPLLVSLDLDVKKDNYVANYFEGKTENVTSSGMSNKGFVMNLNVTQKKDVTKKKSSGNVENLKGGSK